MPELPEIYNLAGQMDRELRRKTVAGVEVRQEKCLNVSVADFMELVSGKTIERVTSRGKWLFTQLEPGSVFLLSLGMGGNLLYHRDRTTIPEKYQVRFDFNDDSALSVGFWWFGYAHAVREEALSTHKMTADLGINPLNSVEYTREHFEALLRGKKGNIKSFLMDQKNIAGIGNVYIQDILFRAGLHPDRKIPSISPAERDNLFIIIRENLESCAALGGLIHERDLYNQPGRFQEFLVGYREGQPCPTCGTAVQKIKTGSTASFICPECQRV